MPFKYPSKPLLPTRPLLPAAKTDITLLDQEYKDFFSQLSKDTLKKATYFEDIPCLTYRNAFRIDKKGDKNNICFNSVYGKYLSKYNTPKDRSAHKEKKISTKNVIRKQIVESKRKRYFV